MPNANCIMHNVLCIGVFFWDMYFALFSTFWTCVENVFLKIKCLFYKIEPLDFHWILNCVRLVLGFA